MSWKRTIERVMMRVLSYNIHKGIGGRDRLYRLERILETIDEQSPDFICLQEVDQNVRRSNYDDQPAIFVDHFKFSTHVFQLNVVRKNGGGYGNLILSRWPFSVVHDVDLKLHSYKTRGALATVIETPEGPLHLASCHLGLLEKHRQLQIERLVQHEAFQKAENLPTLIVGDMNDWMNTLHKGAFREHHFVQITNPASKFRSFPAFFPMGGLDKAFCHGSIVIDEARVIKNRLTRAASDHLPLVIDFHLT